MRFVLPPVAALMALSLLAGSVSAAEPSKKVAEFLGAEAVEVLKAPDKVECFRIDPVKQKAEGTAKRIAGYAITAQGKDQDAAFGGKVAAVLFDEKTYSFESAKECIFSPGVAFRVWKGKVPIEVILCFDCNELNVVTNTRDEPFTAHEDFDNARAKLVALAKAAFPDDKTIQSLKEKE